MYVHNTVRSMTDFEIIGGRGGPSWVMVESWLSLVRICSIKKDHAILYVRPRSGSATHSQ